MIPEDESRPLPPDARLDATLRVVVGTVLIVGGGFLLLEFVHWLAHGGLRPFLIGTAISLVFFFFLVLWSQFLARGGRSLRRKPSLYSLLGIATALGILIQHFLT